MDPVTAVGCCAGPGPLSQGTRVNSPSLSAVLAIFTICVSEVFFPDGPHGAQVGRRDGDLSAPFPCLHRRTLVTGHAGHVMCVSVLQGQLAGHSLGCPRAKGLQAGVGSGVWGCFPVAVPSPSAGNDLALLGAPQPGCRLPGHCWVPHFCRL